MSKEDIHTCYETAKDWDQWSLAGNARKAIKAMQEALDSIPEEFREKAYIDIDVSESYGDTYCDIRMMYERPENDKERELRRQRAQMQEKLDRKQYEVFKKKFEKQGK